MGRGHGGTRSGGAGGGAVGKAVRERESAIRNEHLENIAVFDRDGNIIYQDVGEIGSVSPGDIWTYRDKDVVITHNHPNIDEKGNLRADGGGSFSPNDVAVAIASNAKEIRAVTPTHTFSLKRPKEGWGEARIKGGFEIMGEHIKVQTEVQRKNLRYIIGVSKRGGDYLTAIRRASSIDGHQAMKEMARRYGWEYTVKRN